MTQYIEKKLVLKEVIEETQVGCGSLTPFAGSDKDIIISHDAYIYPPHQGKGLGQKYHQVRIDDAERESYSLMLCVVNSTNAAEIHILEKNKWEKLKEFASRYSGHTLFLYGKTLG